MVELVAVSMIRAAKDAHFIAFLVNSLSKGPPGRNSSSTMKVHLLGVGHTVRAQPHITSAESLFHPGGAWDSLEEVESSATGQERAQKRDELCQTQMLQIVVSSQSTFFLPGKTIQSEPPVWTQHSLASRHLEIQPISQALSSSAVSATAFLAFLSFIPPGFLAKMVFAPPATSGSVPMR